MKRPGLILLLLASLVSGGAARRDVFDKQNLLAWCIVPFDARQRGPEERARMLEGLGIPMLAYDWRDKHIPSFDEEVDALKRHHIKLQAFYVSGGDPKRIQMVLDFVKRRSPGTEIWWHFNPPQDLSHEQKIEATCALLKDMAAQAAGFRSKVGMYNHGGWFGDPENQIAVIRRLKMKNVGIVYNFHHAHRDLDRFPALFRKMLPYLLAVNLNGMRREGPMILPIGEGDRELDMLKVIRESNYRGPVGILCHREDIDAEVALRGNLEGLAKLADLSARPRGR